MLLKLKKNRADTWQIASLVALARNDSIVEKNYWLIRKPFSLEYN